MDCALSLSEVIADDRMQSIGLSEIHVTIINDGSTENYMVMLITMDRLEGNIRPLDRIIDTNRSGCNYRHESKKDKIGKETYGSTGIQASPFSRVYKRIKSQYLVDDGSCER